MFLPGLQSSYPVSAPFLAVRDFDEPSLLQDRSTLVVSTRVLHPFGVFSISLAYVKASLICEIMSRGFTLPSYYRDGPLLTV